MKSHVLVIVDYEPASTVTLNRAAQFIDATDARVSVLAYIDTAGGNSQDISESQRMETLETLTRKSLGNRSRLSLDIIATPDIARHCADYCQREQVSLVIKTGHRSESLLHTPLDWQLLESLPCPAIILADRNLSDERRMLVTLDLQSHNPAQLALDRAVLEWSADCVRQRGFQLYIACCIEAADPLTQADLQVLMDLENRMRPLLEPKVHRWLEELSLNCRGILISAGKPATVIRRLSEELDADLVVAGCPNRHGLARALLGHTAEKLMHRLERNLAVVPCQAGGQAVNDSGNQA